MKSVGKYLGRRLFAASAAMIPLTLGIYWPVYLASSGDVASMALRVVMIGLATALAALSFDAPATRAEIVLAAMLGLFLIALAVASLMAADPIRAFRDVAKLASMCWIGLGLARAFRSRNAARTFGYSMLAGSAMLIVFILTLYIGQMGFTLPTYTALRVMKGILARKEDLSLNAISFSAIFMSVIGLCLVRPARWAWWLLGVVFATAAIFTGSRGPTAILAASAAALLVLHLVRSHSPLHRASGWVIASTLALAVGASAALLSPQDMRSLTEGRSALWRVAWSEFVEQPIVGHGLESWRDDIPNVPGEYSVSSGAGQFAGAYHNEYMTLLAEGGLVAFLPALVIVLWLLRCSGWIAFRSSVPRANGYMILFGCLLLLARAAIEVPGLFGYAQEPADYLAYVFLAVVISQLSINEDNRRTVARLQPVAAYPSTGPSLLRQLRTAAHSNFPR